MDCTQGCTFFQPATLWTQDPDNHTLSVCLPGFQKDEFKVQVDCRGKLTIRGRRPLGDGKYMRLEQVFDVPKDSHIDKIRGKFEEARLTLFMPKKVLTEKQEPQRAVSCGNKPQEAQTPKDEAKDSAIEEDKKKPEEAQTPKDEPKHGAVKEEKSTQQQEPGSNKVGDDRLQEYKEKAMAWKLKIAEEVEGWLDYGMMDGLLETISKNKKAIAVAAAAFTAGFIVAGKLRSSGR